jgi:hypothetical protein
MFNNLLYSFLISGLTFCCTVSAAQRVYERELLVTGCARSGTGYISKLLTEAGYAIDHERIGKFGTSAWPMAIISDYAPWGPPATSANFKHIFHQVRHPVKVISSVYTSEPKRSWEYIMKYIPEIESKDSHVTKCAKYWYYWNLKASARAEWTYRVEAINSLWEEFEGRLGTKLDRTAFNRVSLTTNRRNGAHRVFTWRDLKLALEPELFHNIQSLAVIYGYSLED